MVTKFKIFENNDITNITEGDYVLLKVKTLEVEYDDFINNNIGEIIRINTRYDYDNNIYLTNKVEVKYVVNGDKFNKLHTYFRYLDFDYNDDKYTFSNIFKISNVAYYGKTEEEVRIKSAINKYNL